MDKPGWSAHDLEVIARLREAGAAPTLDPATRERIRRKITTAEPETELRNRPSKRRRLAANLLAAAAAALIALAGLGMVLSRDSLPGDPLYQVKRATESAALGLTFGNAAKANRHLNFAATRLDELIELATPDSATVNDFTREAKAGAAELTTLGVQGSGRELTTLRSWVREQTAKAVPFPAVNELLARIDARARALMDRLECYRITTGQSDELGAVPAEGACQPPAKAASGPSLPPAQPATPREAMPGLSETRSSESVEVPAATPPVPPAEGEPVPSGTLPPILGPTSTPTPEPSSPRPPLLSIPPLLPGLPGVGIG